MTVVFDASVLLIAVSPNTPAPTDSHGKPIPDARDRIDYLIEELERERTKIVIPTPAIAELLVRGGTAGPEYLDILNQQSVFKLAPFDVKAAVELAVMTREALSSGPDKRGGLDGTWAKVKFDRQIVAIAKSEGASVIYSNDNGVKKLGESMGMQVIGFGDLPTRPTTDQMNFLPDEEPKNEKD